MSKHGGTVACIHKWDRLNKYDGRIWDFFRSIFKDAEANLLLSLLVRKRIYLPKK